MFLPAPLEVFLRSSRNRHTRADGDFADNIDRTVIPTQSHTPI